MHDVVSQRNQSVDWLAAQLSGQDALATIIGAYKQECDDRQVSASLFPNWVRAAELVSDVKQVVDYVSGSRGRLQ